LNPAAGGGDLSCRVLRIGGAGLLGARLVPGVKRSSHGGVNTGFRLDLTQPKVQVRRYHAPHHRH
jgi:hypothetical protein